MSRFLAEPRSYVVYVEYSCIVWLVPYDDRMTNIHITVYMYNNVMIMTIYNSQNIYKLHVINMIDIYQLD